jgi:predicted DNA-binding protein with PD1-like motif
MVGSLLLRISNNEDIFDSIKNFVIENNIKSGFFVSVKGYIKDFEIMVNERHGLLNNQKNNGIFDVNNVSGKIQWINGKVDVGMRVSVSSTGFTTCSGQLVKGRAANFLELEIKNMDSSKMIIA